METIAPPLLVCNESSRFVAAEQLREIGIDNARILLEPMRRNTAPAIPTPAPQTLSAPQDPLLLLLLLPDDSRKFHDVFCTEIHFALQAQIEGDLVTFGIKPQGPETGYGYIRAASSETRSAQLVLEFVEKPNRAT